MNKADQRNEEKDLKKNITASSYGLTGGFTQKVEIITLPWIPMLPLIPMILDFKDGFQIGVWNDGEMAPGSGV